MHATLKKSSMFVTSCETCFSVKKLLSYFFLIKKSDKLFLKLSNLCLTSFLQLTMLKYNLIRHFSKVLIIKLYDYTRHFFLCLTQTCAEKNIPESILLSIVRKYHIFRIKADLEFHTQIIKRDAFLSQQRF